MGMMRIGGLATGMDTDKMVKDMMKPYNMRVDKMKQDTTVVKWQQDAYREVMDDISGLSKKYFDVLNGDKYMLSSNNFSALKPVGISQDSGLKIKANTTGVEGHYSVKVDKIATKAKVEATITKDFDLNKKISTILTGKVQFTINGENFDYDFSTKDNEKTIGDILSDISGSNAKVDARYSQLTKKIIFSSDKEGTDGEIDIKDSSNFLEKLFGKSMAGKVQGEESRVTITSPDGTNTVTQKSNSFTIDGVSYDISGVKEGKSVDFALEGNSDETFEKVKGFIEDYNKLIDKVQKKLTEKKNRNFKPLTEEEKKEMKEKDVKLWEEKAKSGLLRGDSNLQNMLTSLRRAFFDKVEGAGLTLRELGLNTSVNYKEGGKIVFDQNVDKNGNSGEARLKKLLKEDPNKVFKIFSKESTTYPSYSPDLTMSERQKRNDEEGILQRINDIFKDYTRTTRSSTGRRGVFVEKAGIKGTTSEINNSLFKELEKREKMIKDMEKKLAERENKYYIQFSKLEKYMNKMNAQSSWLSQQFGGR